MTLLIAGKMSGDFSASERFAVCFCHHRHFIRSFSVSFFGNQLLDLTKIGSHGREALVNVNGAFDCVHWWYEL